MLSKLDHFYFDQSEPLKGCLLALKEIVLALDENITPEWKYGMPFFYYKGKMFCYFWKDKKTNEPYIGVIKGKEIEHQQLELGNRKRIPILRVNPNNDIDIETIQEILSKAISLYKSDI